MKSAVPTLSSRGWLSQNDEEKIAQLIAQYFATDGAQDYVYNTSIRTVPDIMKEFGDNIGELLITLRTSIYKLLINYFDSVEIDVVQRANEVEPNKLIIVINCDVVNDDQRYPLNIAYSLEGSKFKAYIDINNGDA
jgi:hypothetical protein